MTSNVYIQWKQCVLIDLITNKNAMMYPHAQHIIVIMRPKRQSDEIWH